MDQSSNIYGTVVKRTVMEEDKSYSKEVHDPSVIHHTKKDSWWSPCLVLTTVAMTLGGSIPVGYISGAGINPYHVEDNWVELENWLNTDTLRTLLLVAGAAGSLLSIPLNNWLGRRKSVIGGTIAGVVGAVLHIAASIIWSSSLLILAWAALGISIGVCVSVLPMYLVEVAPPGYHMSLGATFTVGTTIGALLSQILSLHCALGSGSAHPLLLPIFVIPVLIAWFLLPHVPESPLYLYSVKKDNSAAEEELSKLRGVERTAAALELSLFVKSEATAVWSCNQLIQQPQLTFLLLVCMVHLCHALCKADQIHHLSNFDMDFAEADAVATMFIASVANCIVALVVVHLMSAVSWRVLLIFSTLLSAVFFMVMASFTLLGDTSGKLQYLVLASLLVQVVVFDLGLRPISYFLGCELFDTTACTTVMAIGGATKFISQLCSDHLYTLFDPALIRLFTSFVLALLTLVLLFIPESDYYLKSTRTVNFKPERRISYTPNPHRTPGAGDRYKRKSEERKASISL